MEDHTRVEVKSRKELRAWLRVHHKQSESIWLVTYKKSTPELHVSYDEIVEEALCFGWIDSLPRKLDEKRTMLRLSPRKPKSAWSKINKDRVKKLIAQKRMTKAGLLVIEAARKSGTWDVLNAVEAATLPKDLLAAFRMFPGSKKNFDAFPPSSRRAILEWISTAKTLATREKRVTETARLAAENVRANHYRQPKQTKT